MAQRMPPTGHQQTTHKHPPSRRAFSLVEILIVIATIGILITLLIPVLSRVRQQAQTTRCLSNLRQIGQAFFAYANNNRNKIVPADLMPPDPYKPVLRLGNWATLLVSQGYLTAPDMADESLDAAQSVLYCPDGQDFNGFHNDAYTAQRADDAQSGYWERREVALMPDGSIQPGVTVRVWYGINADTVGDDFPTFRCPGDTGRSSARNFTDMRDSSKMALVYDGFFHHDGQPNLMGHARHNSRTVTNVLFADGHVESVKTASLPKSLTPADLAAAPFPRFRLSQ